MEVHNNKFDYSLMQWKNFTSKVSIICPVHGVFTQVLNDHVYGIGCKLCASNALSTIEVFIAKANKVHNSIYNYTNSRYISAIDKITVCCKEHGEFTLRADHHLRGQGCSGCSEYGFDGTKPAYLYYLKVTADDGQVLYKIGITNRTIKKRFNVTDLTKIEIINQKLYTLGSEALATETKLKHKFKAYQYKGPAVLSSGNTELFTIDVLS